MPVVLPQTCTACAFFFTIKWDKSLVRDARKEHWGLGLAHSGARARVLPTQHLQRQPQGWSQGGTTSTQPKRSHLGILRLPGLLPHWPRLLDGRAHSTSQQLWLCCSAIPQQKPQEWLWAAPEMLYPWEQLGHLWGAAPAVGPKNAFQRQQHLQIPPQGQSQSPCRCPVGGDGSLHPAQPLCHALARGQPWHCPAPLQDMDTGQGMGASVAMAWKRGRARAGGPIAIQLRLLDMHWP